MLTFEEFEEWRTHPVTKQVMEFFQARIFEAQEAWFNEEFEKDTSEETALANARALGRAKGLGEILALSHDRYIGVLSEQHERLEAIRQQSSSQTIRNGEDE